MKEDYLNLKGMRETSGYTYTEDSFQELWGKLDSVQLCPLSKEYSANFRLDSLTWIGWPGHTWPMFCFQFSISVIGFWFSIFDFFVFCSVSVFHFLFSVFHVGMLSSSNIVINEISHMFYFPFAFVELEVF